ncbi:hypothetical protein [Amycolatopsis taiwanensis]|uniref:Uncharacterized protein n=1 Tax=Amycolatopsis taiwanensis TaxID=342230 RepID=A0A9W6R1M5_9PSEU|nr:hypothetical protein [Amycolatopsis taiwanensis]GLY65890.1 hypothetical protein Atai01_25090 [Amycolatopsis taiwanensis]
MSAEARPPRHNPLQEIFWTRTGLLLLVLVVLSGVCLTISGAMPLGMGRNLVNAAGTGTLVSAIVGFGQTLITATAAQRALVSPVIEESRRTLRELAAEYRSMNKEFFPTHVFEATVQPDPALNRLMMRDLHATRQYFFRGFSARYAAARLLLSQAEWELRVIIADPRDATTLSGRARYLLRHEGAAADADRIQRELSHEVSMGLIGLYLARSRSTRIDVTVIADPPLDRLEMFDDSVWIHLYSDVSSVSTLYPRTLRFSEGSFLYNMERVEFLRVCQSRSARHFQLAPDTTRQEFMALYQKVTGHPLTEEVFRELETEFHVFQHNFSIAASLEN